MSNPWAEVYKDFRSELLGESEDLQERRRLADVKTASRQGKYDLKSRVAKMRAAGKSPAEIQAWVDNYLRNSKLPGNDKMQIRQSALNSSYELDGDLVDEGAAGLLRAGLAAGTALAGMAVANKAKKVAGEIEKTNKKKQQQIDQLLNQSVEIDGDDIQEVAPPSAKAERMVKHVKAGYKKGGLTKKEKSIAYATAWKQYNKQKNEEYVMEEGGGEYVVVRITKENGQIFEKKVPSNKVDELRKRYKSVVVVGSKEKTGSMKAEAYVEESSHKKKNVKRWWDDDGDGVGYEPGEVSGKFKKGKKKTKSESYSDWRNELQLDENQLGLTPAEMREAGQKKNEANGESFSSVSECGSHGWNGWEEQVSLFAEELGGEVLEFEVLDENAGKVVAQALRTIVKQAGKLDDIKIGPMKGGDLVGPVKKGELAKTPKPAKLDLTPLEKAEIQRARSTSIKDKPTAEIELSTGKRVKIDSKTGAITQVEPKGETLTQTVTKLAPPQTQTQTQTKSQTQTQTQTKTPDRGGVGTLPPGGGPGGGGRRGRGLRLAIPAIGIEEPKNVGSIVKV